MNLKRYIDSLKGKPVAVFGLGKSGISTIKALSKAGVKVYAWDQHPEAQQNAIIVGAQIEPLKASLLKKCAHLILSPGIPLHYPKPHDVVQAAQEAQCEIIGDIEIFYLANPEYKTLALTGTNGKSTTATLMNHVLQTCGYQSVLCGNIGRPVLDAKFPSKKHGVAVLELSSYQLDLCLDFEADISVLLNITPDHIDRHGTMDEYAATKARIFKGTGHAIISVDDEHTKSIYNKISENLSRTVVPISTFHEVNKGVYVRDGVLFDHMEEECFEVGSMNGIVKLNGTHNHQNAAATYAAMRLLGMSAADILNAFITYPGLAHRQFPSRVINGISYINDSKATNAVATSKALAAHKNIYWIVGGRKKDNGLQGLEPYVGNVIHAFLVGETMDEFADWMEQQNIKYEKSHTVNIALEQAHYMAQKSRGQPGTSGVVMLSPACASFDQFSTFEERGEYFESLVQALDEESPLE